MVGIMQSGKVDVDGRITLKWILEDHSVTILREQNWLSRGKACGFVKMVISVLLL
jgi:hypothetical protein